MLQTRARCAWRRRGTAAGVCPARLYQARTVNADSFTLRLDEVPLQIDRTLYQVKTGQRIGQNFGVVTKVGEQEVAIREVVQDAGGEWVERMSKLELQESKEKGK